MVKTEVMIKLLLTGALYIIETAIY